MCNNRIQDEVAYFGAIQDGRNESLTVEEILVKVNDMTIDEMNELVTSITEMIDTEMIDVKFKRWELEEMVTMLSCIEQEQLDTTIWYNSSSQSGCIAGLWIALNPDKTGLKLKESKYNNIRLKDDCYIAYDKDEQEYTDGYALAEYYGIPLSEIHELFFPDSEDTIKVLIDRFKAFMTTI